MKVKIFSVSIIHRFIQWIHITQQTVHSTHNTLGFLCLFIQFEDASLYQWLFVYCLPICVTYTVRSVGLLRIDTGTRVHTSKIQ